GVLWWKRRAERRRSATPVANDLNHVGPRNLLLPLNNRQETRPESKYLLHDIEADNPASNPHCIQFGGVGICCPVIQIEGSSESGEPCRHVSARGHPFDGRFKEYAPSI